MFFEPQITNMVKLFTSLFLLLAAYPSNCSSPKTSEQQEREAIVAKAQSLLGTAYRYGNCSPEQGFDCSGFVYYVFQFFNFDVPRSSKAYATLPKTCLQEAKVGDIIVFTGYKNRNKTPGHVGIISKIERNKLFFIHSSTYKGVIESELYGSHYKQRYLFVTKTY